MSAVLDEGHLSNYNNIDDTYVAVKSAFEEMLEQSSIEFLREYFMLVFWLTSTADIDIRNNTISKMRQLRQKNGYDSDIFADFEKSLIRNVCRKVDKNKGEKVH